MSNWLFPLKNWKGEIPVGTHPGAFGAKRKYDTHTGVDLYVPTTKCVLAVESGFCVAIEEYTGPAAGSPWWLPTKAILVEGKSGVVCYGEVSPMGISKGDHVLQGMVLGIVAPVLQEGKERTDIPGHSRYMLHFELYEHGTIESVWWPSNHKKPENLLDPTNLLLDSLKSD